MNPVDEQHEKMIKNDLGMMWSIFWVLVSLLVSSLFLSGFLLS